MSRRLLGYVVKLPNGEWHDGKSRADKDFDGYPWTRDAKKRHVFVEYQDACRYVLTYVPENLLRIVPVFSKPKPAEPEPAPVVAAEGPKPVAYRYDVAGYPPSWATFRIGDVQGQTETPLYDEAALAAAREEGRREGASQALTTCRARLEHWLDLWSHRVRAPEYPGDEVASGAKIEAYEQAILTIDEAAKGAAK